MIDGPRAHIIAIKRDCPLCFGTGYEKPTKTETMACINGCMAATYRHMPGQRFAGKSHPQVLVEGPNKEVAWVDEGIAELIRLMWYSGVMTYLSCQGDEAHSSWVAIADLTKLARAIVVIEEFGKMVEYVEHRLMHNNLPEDYFIQFVPQTSAFVPRAVSDVAVSPADGAEDAGGDGQRSEPDETVVAGLDAGHVAEHDVPTTSSR